MTTIIPFVPSRIKAPSFDATLDGAVYSITVTWNVSARRYYINVYDQNSTWILTVPLISTPPGRAVDSVVYDPFLNRCTVTLVSPSEWPVPLSPSGINTKPGTMIDYTLQGFQPDTYNGKVRGMHINETTFVFPMASDPGPLVVVGTVHRFLNMVESVFFNSSLIYRNRAFQIDP